MKKLGKRSVALILSILFVLSAAVPALAADKLNKQKENLKEKEPETKIASYEDVIALDPYVSVVKGQYVIDKKAATAAGISKELIDSQAEQIKTINQEAKDGLITISEDKAFKVESDKSAFSVTVLEEHSDADNLQGCRGGYNSTGFYWWGVRRYACDCETRRIANNLKWCSNIVNLILSIFKIPNAYARAALNFGKWYWNQLADRMNAHNYGRGVQVNLTWVLAFATYAQ